MKNYWLVKQEPSSYSWSDFVEEGKTSWTGVRNYTARNNLREMRKGDEVLFYHSGEEKAVVGIAKVTSCTGQTTATAGNAKRNQSQSAAQRNSARSAIAFIRDAAD